MPMDRHFRPDLQSIQHTLRTVLSRRPKVKVHTFTLRSLSLQMQCRQHIIIDFNYFHLYSVFDIKVKGKVFFP